MRYALMRLGYTNPRTPAACEAICEVQGSMGAGGGGLTGSSRLESRTPAPAGAREKKREWSCRTAPLILGFLG